MSEVGDDDMGAPTDALDLLGDLFELRLGARRDDHVRTGFGECQRYRGTESATGSGHHSHLVVQPKSIEYHVSLSSLTGRHRNKAASATCRISETRSS